jgi:pyruvate formate lyase activating enzyme
MESSSPVFKIQRFSIHDGPGIRTTLFFKGCPLRCAWCHNPESQGRSPLLPEQDVTSVCDALMVTIEKDMIFYEQSKGGVTFSGGEPLCQPHLVAALADRCKSLEIHTCLDTSGFAPFPALEALAQKVDMVLYDIKLMDSQAHATFTGVTPELIFDNLARLSDLKIPLRLRLPLIPGITDSRENILGLASFLKGSTIYRDVHILPFHKAGDGKYEQLKIKNRLKKTAVPTGRQIADAVKIFESKGFAVTIGG